MKKTSLLGRKGLFVLSLTAALLFAVSVINDPVANAQRRGIKIDPELLSGPDVVTSGTITGKVFQDFNGNGTMDTTLTIANSGFGTVGVAVDRGVANVQVRAYSAAGANVTPGGVVTTDASGNYSLTTTDAGSGPYRLEFTSLPAGYQPSARSKSSVGPGTVTNAGSTVQFVSSGATNVNLAINYPSDYSQNNPEIVASMYAEGDQIIGGNTDASVLLSFPYSAGSSDSSTAATEANFDMPTTWPLDLPANQVGTTFGLAYARQTGRVYAASYFKRHAGFGPQGPNAIYVINRAGTGSVSNFFVVPGTATNSHDAANWNRDNGNTGWNAVGTTSLGGLAMSEDESRLYVFNLANRTLYALNSVTGAQLASQAAPTNLPVPSGTCAAADAKPFALTMYHGQLYAGLVCSAESSANADTFSDANANGVWDSGDYYIDQNGNGSRDATEPYLELTGNTSYTAPETFTDGDGNGAYNGGDVRSLRAYVYTVDPTTLAFSASPVLTVPLNYKRGMTTHSQSANGVWRPWSSTYRDSMTGTRVVYPQPMLTDIAFDNGNMILGIRDRVGDQTGNGALSNPNDASNTNLYQPRTAGDIIRACGAPNSWVIESNGRCGGNGTAPQNVAEGPGGGEFYFGDSYDLSGDFISPATTVMGKGGNHDDTGNGGVEQLPGAPDVVISDFDPIPNIANMTHDGGIRWLSNTTGAFAKGYRLYNGAGNDTNVFGKAGGVGGNLVMLSNPAPIEIGNHVWRDTDLDGAQDPGESNIAGVTVHLFLGSTSVGTAVTDSNGEYYFISSASPDPNTADSIGQVNGGISGNTAYQVRFDRPADYQSGGVLFGLLPTRQHMTMQLGDDNANDSDAVNVANPSGSPAGTFPVISLTTGGVGANDHTFDVGFSNVPTAAPVTIDGRIMLPDGTGIRSVVVSVTNADGKTVSTVSSSFGYYHFDGIMSGETVVVSVAAKRFHFNPASRFIRLDDAITGLDFVAN